MKLLLHAAMAALAISCAGAQNTPLLIEGSNTFGEKLGPLLAAAYRDKYPEAVIKIKTPGSGSGLSALIRGETDIAPSSRPANEDELQAAKAADVRLIPQVIGSYAIAIIVNERNPIRNLKPEQVRDVFTGRITNWKELGGPDAHIRPFALNNSTGARLGFREIVLLGDQYGKTTRGRRNYAEIARTVAADPHAIGYLGMGALPPGVRTVSVNHQPPNSLAVYERVYPYYRTLYLYTLERRASHDARQFIRFVLSKEGQHILQNAGYAPRMPLPDAAMGGNIAP